MSTDQVAFAVLGPVSAERDGVPLALKGPRHRAVLARLIVARGRVVPVARLVADLWDEPPPAAVGALRTFVGDLRRALEPGRPPRAPARLLVTDGPGYALRTDAVDARRFEAALETAAEAEPAEAARLLRAALELWRGPAYAEFADEPWCRGERARLTELRLRAVEQRATALLAAGRAADAVPDLDAHLAEHPWREEGRRLLALALYRTGRQGDALAVLRAARADLAGRLGLDPGPALRRLEAAVLAQDPALDGDLGAGRGAAGRVWSRVAEVYDRTVATGARARLESTVGLLRTLAVTGSGGLVAAREHRLAAIAAAEEAGDPELTARLIGAYDVPAIWTRSDDPAGARRVTEAAERALARLPATGTHDATRCRLLATIALESRGSRSARAPEAAAEAERLARRLDDPALLAFALNAVFMQSCTRAGLAPRRDAIGTELVGLATRHGLVTYEVLGHLIRVQARAALADFATADAHAQAADHLADRHELPLTGVFTTAYRALRLTATGHPGPTGAPGGQVESAGPAADSPASRPTGGAGVAVGPGGGVTQSDGALTAPGGTGPAAGPGGQVESAGPAADSPASRPTGGAGVVAGPGGGVTQSDGALTAPGGTGPAGGPGGRVECAGPAADSPASRPTGGAGVVAGPGGGGVQPDGGAGSARVAGPGGGGVLPAGWGRSAPGPSAEGVEVAYREVGRMLEGAGMPGVRDGLLPLALLCARLARSPYGIREAVEPGADWGPYLPWVRPALVLVADGAGAARDTLHELPEPPADLVQEALWCLVAAVALELGDRPTLRRCRDRLHPAAGQLAGAGSGWLTAGPVDTWLAAIEQALR